MPESLVLSRYSLDLFLSCQRKFQLRVLEQVAWPFPPDGDERQRARRLGERFHRRLERHFLGLRDEGITGDEKKTADEAVLAAWWRTFQREGPRLPAGERLVEYTLTVPLGDHFLTGRFDLIVVSGAAAHIFDWKTERRLRSRAALEADTQTRVYLALAAEGGPALRSDGNALDPDRIRLTYWSVNEPAASPTFGYDRAAHEANMIWLRRQAELIAGRAESDRTAWPLTDDWSECGRCPYRILCGRQGAPQSTAQDDLEPENGGSREDSGFFEPPEL